MKKSFRILLILALVCVCHMAAAKEAGVSIDEYNFPDKVFRSIVEGYDLDRDGVLSGKEAAAAVSVDVDRKDVETLQGIEFLTGLEKLNCAGNKLTVLDVSRNTKLKELDCSKNRLPELDISRNTELTELNCRSNQLTELDVSRNTNLKSLHCGINMLAELDVSGNAGLTALYCDSNSIRDLDISMLTELTELDISDCRVNGLDLSLFPGLEKLNCLRCGLTELDVSRNTELKELICSENRLAELDVSGNLKLARLDCSRNLLTKLDVIGNPELDTLYCARNKLTELELGGNPGLRWLNCSENLLTALDVSRNPGMISIDCKENRLIQMNLSGSRYVQILYCSGNQLKALDISRCTELASTVRRRTPAEEEGILKWKADEIFSINRAELYIDPTVNLYAGESMENRTESANGINGDMPVFYNPEGGRHYHFDSHCLGFNMSMKGCFFYAERDKEPYCHLLPCERCAVPMERVEETPYASIGDIKDSIHTVYWPLFSIFAVERDGRIYRVVARMDDKAMELLNESIKESRTETNGNQRVLEYFSYVDTLPVGYEEEITETPVSQEELDAFAGKTLGEVFEQGYQMTDSRFNNYSGADFYISKGMYQYKVYVEISEEKYESRAIREDFNDLIVKSAKPDGVSERATNLSYRPDGTEIESD